MSEASVARERTPLGSERAKVTEATRATLAAANELDIAGSQTKALGLPELQ